MRIEFDTALLEDRENRALVAFLQALSGNAPATAINNMAHEAAKMHDVISKEFGVSKERLAGHPDPKAADGYPVNDAPAELERDADGVVWEKEPDAAAVFGAPSVVLPPTETVNGTVSVGIDRDANGILWDARIHSETKGKTQSGTWKRRRNTPDETFAAVMAELKAAIATEVPTPIPAPPPVAVPPPIETPAPVAVPPPPGAIDFATMMRGVTAAQTAGTFSADQLRACLDKASAKSMAELIDSSAGSGPKREAFWSAFNAR